MSHEHHPHKTFEGSVTDIFAHRFVMEGHGEKLLADYGKHNHVSLKPGDKVSASGKMKASEMKVDKMEVNGQEVDLRGDADRDRRHNDLRDTGDVDLHAIEKTAAKQDIQILGKRRLPKHVEVLGVDQTNSVVEVHIELDGKLKKVKAADREDGKWGNDMPPK